MPVTPPGLMPPEVYAEIHAAADQQFNMLLNWWAQTGPPSAVGGRRHLNNTPTQIPARATQKLQEFYDEQGFQRVQVRGYYVSTDTNIQPGDNIQESTDDQSLPRFPIVEVIVQPGPATPVIKSVWIGAA